MVTCVTNQYLEVQPGIVLHYASIGLEDHHKPLLVMLHGFPEFWRAWEPVMLRLASQYRLVAPDLRGFNLSSKPASVRAYAAKHVVADIVGLIDRLQTKQSHSRVVLAAHDWGGAIAWNLAAQFGDRIDALVIVNSPHPVRFWWALCYDPAQQQASEYMNWLRKPGCEAALAENKFTRLESFFHKMGGVDWYTPILAAQYHEAWGQPGAITGGCQYYRASPLYPPTAQDPGPLNIQLDLAAFFIAKPTLIIWGEADIALRPVLIEQLEPHFKALTIKRFPYCSHWILHEAPQTVADTMSGFLATLPVQ